MPEMAEVIDRDPTAINADLSWLQWEKGFRAAGDGVGKPQGRHQAQKGGIKSRFMPDCAVQKPWMDGRSEQVLPLLFALDGKTERGLRSTLQHSNALLLKP